jgi:hypothetical protein
MWTVLFAVTMVAAISFVLAAACMSLRVHRENRWSLIGEFAAGCRDLSRAACAAFGRGGLSVVTRSFRHATRRVPNCRAFRQRSFAT